MKAQSLSLFYRWQKRYDYEIVVVRPRSTINEEKDRKRKNKIAEYDQQRC